MSAKSKIERPSKAYAQLGVTASSREVGFAVVVNGNLIRHGILNVRKIPSPALREFRFGEAMGKLLDKYEPARVVLVTADVSDEESLPAIERTWFEEQARRRRFRLKKMDAGDVRSSFVADGRATNRTMADAIAARFPSVWRGTLSATPVREDPAFKPRRRERTSREAYWRNAFLAIGACAISVDTHPTQ